MTTPARIRCDAAEAFLDAHASALKEACRAMDAEMNAELLRADPKAEVSTPELDFYDQFDIFLLHSPSPNAATPGDNCAEITTRLFLEAEYPEQVVAALAHEFGHIRCLHTINGVQRRLETEVVVAIVAGIGAGVDAHASASNPYYKPTTNWGTWMNNVMATYRPWRKEDEFEADQLGLRLYQRLGLDPDRYKSLFSLLGEWGDKESESHPRISDRIARIEAALSERPAVASTRELDGNAFRSTQATLAQHLKDLDSKGFLVSNEDVQGTAKKSGRGRAQVACCGPLDRDPVLLNAGFDAILERRSVRPESQPGSEPGSPPEVPTQ
jgi:predicted Zn-dependent protease